MQKFDCGAIPVTDKSTGELKGVVTDRDLVVRCVAQGSDPKTVQVKEIMSSECVCVAPSDDARRVANLMSSKHLRRLLVVDEKKKCLGIVALADVAKGVDEPQLLANILKGVSTNA